MSTTKEVDFLFLVEHEDREFYSVRRIAEEIQKLGPSSLILSMEFFGHIVTELQVKTIVLPYAISSETWPLKVILKALPEVQIVSLNWEQLLSEANKDFKRPRDSYIKDFIHHLAWSESYKQFLTESGVQDAQVTVIDNPLTQSLWEFVSNNTETKAQLHSEFSLDESRDTIFLPMNYGWAFYNDNVIQKKIAQGYNKDIAYEYRAYSRRCLKEFCFFVRSLALKHEFNIVVRPHPSISIEQYVAEFEKYVKQVPVDVVITKKYTIKEWISISNVVGSSWSTSVWDAANIGKKVFLFTPFSRPVWLNTWWNDLVPNIQSVEQIMVNDDAYARPKELSPSTIIPRIANWLNSVESQDCLKITRSNSFVKNWRLYINIYTIRCRLRAFSMKFMRGAFVKKGMRRDYFPPFFID